MPHSYGYFKQEIKQHFLTYFSNSISILDVGPGAGTYAKLLSPEYTNVDAVEIFEDYVTKYNLHSLYQHVFIDNIINFDASKYEYVILGDVLEHLSILDAQSLLEKINISQKCLVAVPYMFEQGESEGNIHEAHLQPDLTHEVFLERYPYMYELYRNDYYGYYVNYNIDNLLPLDWKFELNKLMSRE